MVDPTHVAAVGPAAAILFARICYRAGEGSWRATRDAMAQETGLSPDMIRTAVKVLRDREWVIAERSDTYDAALVWTPVFAGHAEMGEFPMSRLREIPTSDVGNFPISSYETLKTSPISPQPEPVLFTPVEAERPDPLAGFDEWYGLFPRKVAKGDARKAWTQVTRKTSADVILAGLRRNLATLQAKHAEGFCPYPASWLRAERWEDMPENVHPIRPPSSQWDMTPPPPGWVPPPPGNYDSLNANVR